MSILTFLGCGHQQTITINKLSAKAPQDVTTPLAGITEVDITPPPGLPKAGYAAWAQDGDGFRTRLYARVFYLKPKQGEPIAIVQMDLLAGSAILHHKIAEKIAAVTDIQSHNLSITATHTHAAPGQFLESNFYNQFASNRAGFDPDWFNFLVNRISDSVIKAYQERRPVKIATGKTEVWGLTRNRSFAPYLQNQNVNVPDAPQGKYHAINPDLFLVRFDIQNDQGIYEPRGAFSIFSIHGTGISSHTNEYNADVWSYIAHDLEWQIQAHYHPSMKPIHGAFEGTHADMAPNVRFGMLGYIESRRIGSAISEKAWELFQSLDTKLTDDIKVRSALREIDVYKNPTIDDISLCERPVVGTALAGGANEHRSPIIGYIPPIAPGWPRWFFTHGCQGHKRTLASALQYLVLAKKDFPHQLLAQLLTINDLAIVGLPFEITVQSGRAIADSVNAVFQQHNERLMVAVSGVVNGYTGYTTTPEEYTRQYYEGGHTLYGPQSTPFLAAQSAKLADDLLNQQKNIADLPSQWNYVLNIHSFYPPQLTTHQERRMARSPRFYDASVHVEPSWSFRWYDVPPAAINFHDDLIRVEVSDDQKNWSPLLIEGRPVNDRGYDIAVHYLHLDRKTQQGLYEVRWYNPEMNPTRFYRFAILPRGNSSIWYSPVFH